MSASLPTTGVVVLVSRSCPVCRDVEDLVASIVPDGLAVAVVDERQREVFGRFAPESVPFLVVRREGRDVAWGPVPAFGCSPRAVRAAIEEIVEGYEPGDLRTGPRQRGVDPASVRRLMLALADLCVRVGIGVAGGRLDPDAAARCLRAVAARLRQAEGGS